MPRIVDGVELFTREEMERSGEEALRAAESARQQASTRIIELEEQVAGVRQQAQTLQERVSLSQQEQSTALRRMQGLKALLGAGIGADAAEMLLELPALAEADFASPEGAANAVSALKTTFPALFTAVGVAEQRERPSLAPLGGVGGSPAPVKLAPDLASLTMDEYIAHRGKQRR